MQDPWLKEPVKKQSTAFPLLETLRLYAGWVFFWSMSVLALIAFDTTRELPFAIPYIQDFAQLRTIVIIAAASFLFLLFAVLHRSLKMKKIYGALLAMVWLLAIGFVMQNI